MDQTLSITALAEIRVGFLSRKPLDNDVNGSTHLLQMRDLDTSGYFNYKTALQTNLDPKELARFAVKEADILLMNRSEPIRAALITNPPPNTLASAHFFIIRPISNEVIPAFLARILNQLYAQNYFRKYLAGTSVKMLTMKSLEQLKIAIPPIAIQEKIIHLEQLNYRHKKLSQQLQQKIDLLIKHVSSGQISKN
ncbi:MAG: restriction endonuclease subunit S [Bdellovibrionota bacterium]